MELRMIKTKADYEAGMATLNQLMDQDPAPDTPDADKLEVLALLLEQYEDKHFFMDKGGLILHPTQKAPPRRGFLLTAVYYG